MFAEMVADLHAIFLGNDLTVQLRVHQRDVVSLAIVVAVDLPVGGDAVHEPVAVREIFERLVGDCREERAVVVGQRCGGLVEIDEHESAPLVDGHLYEPELVEHESLVAEVARGAEPAIQCVCPTVVPAGEACEMSAIVCHQWAGAMAADVVESAQCTVVLDDHDDRPPGEVVTHVVAGLSQRRTEAGELPLAPEDRAPLVLVHRGIGVHPGGTRRCHGLISTAPGRRSFGAISRSGPSMYVVASRSPAMTRTVPGSITSRISSS